MLFKLFITIITTASGIKGNIDVIQTSRQMKERQIFRDIILETKMAVVSGLNQLECATSCHEMPGCKAAMLAGSACVHYEKHSCQKVTWEKLASQLLYYKSLK